MGTGAAPATGRAFVAADPIYSRRDCIGLTKQWTTQATSRGSPSRTPAASARSTEKEKAPRW